MSSKMAPSRMQAPPEGRASRVEEVRARAARARAHEREAAFVRLGRARFWVAGGAGALSLGFAGLAYAMAPGHKLTTAHAGASTSPSVPGSSSQPQGGDDATLQPPAAAPTGNSGSGNSGSGNSGSGNSGSGNSGSGNSGSGQQAAPPSQPAAPVVVSGGS